MLERLSLRIRILLFFVLLALGGIGAMIGGFWLSLARAPQVDGLVPALVQAGVFAGFIMLGLVAWIWLLFDTHVARAIEALANAIRARTHAAVDGDLDRDRARYLGDLAPAAAEATRSLAETRSALAESVARETSRLSAEKARLEKLLADVPVAVLLCTAEHQLVFYNGTAVDLLGAGAAPGLDRNLLEYMREGPIAHAYARLLEAGDPDAASDLLCATTGSARLLAGRMRVLRRTEQGGAPGYVLTLRDVTADMAVHASREALMAEVFDRVRRPAANLQTVIGVVSEAPEMAEGTDLMPAMLDEIATLTSAITELGARYDSGRTDWRPLAETRSADLFDSLRAKFEAEGRALTCIGPELMLRCDGFELVAFFDWLGRALAADGRGRDFRLELTEEDGPGAILDLCWQGGALGVGDFDRWLEEAVDPAAPDLTARAVLNTHGTEAWTELRPGGGAVRMPIRNARRATRRPPPVARAVVYDFELLSKTRNAAVAEARLEDLTYVVFDTETTGLTPSADEIVQIAAVRLVNGRRVRGEVFDTLVDPQRAIPASSTAVHGITRGHGQGRPHHRRSRAAIPCLCARGGADRP